MSFLGNKKKVEMMIKENAEAFRDNQKMLSRPKCKEVIVI